MGSCMDFIWIASMQKKLKYANMTIICLTNILRGQDVEEMNKTLAATLNYLFAGTPSKSN